MGQRLELQKLLEDVLGSKRVYFQPPETIRLEYPCIIYSLDREQPRYADDRPYVFHLRYSVMVIDRDPESKIPLKIRELPMASFNRIYKSDNLNHFVYTIFY